MAQFKKSIAIRAIEMKCAECIYDPRGGGGTWREQTESCSDTACPLYPVRPLTEGKKHDSTPAIPDMVRRRREEWLEVSGKKAIESK